MLRQGISPTASKNTHHYDEGHHKEDLIGSCTLPECEGIVINIILHIIFYQFHMKLTKAYYMADASLPCCLHQTRMIYSQQERLCSKGSELYLCSPYCIIITD